jgi:hypothetical protein
MSDEKIPPIEDTYPLPEPKWIPKKITDASGKTKWTTELVYDRRVHERWANESKANRAKESDQPS